MRKEQQARRAQKAEQALPKEKHQHKALDEERDHLEEIMANTAHLREQRFAKEAGERKSATKAKPRKGGRRR
jgi:hypothetical protein